MIKRPHYAKDAHPTQQGWVNSKGELIKSQRISQEQIDEWYASVTSEPEVQMLHEAPVEKPQRITDAIKKHFFGE